MLSAGGRGRALLGHTAVLQVQGAETGLAAPPRASAGDIPGQLPPRSSFPRPPGDRWDPEAWIIPAGTKNHKSGGLEQRKCVVSQFWRLKSEMEMSAGGFLLDILREGRVRPRLSPCCCCWTHPSRTFLGLWMRHPISVFPLTWPLPVHVCVQMSPFLRTVAIASGTTPTPVGPHLNYLHRQGPYFQIRSQSLVLGVKTST